MEDTPGGGLTVVISLPTAALQVPSAPSPEPEAMA